MTILASASEIEDLSIEQFIAKPGVEALDEAVLPGTAPLNVGPLGPFFPDYSYANPVYEEVKRLIEPILGTARQVSPLQLRSYPHLGPIGHIDLFTLEEPDRAGRGREYDDVFFDEAAFNKPSLVTAFDTAQRPTLLDREGRAVAISTMPTPIFSSASSARRSWAWRHSPPIPTTATTRRLMSGSRRRRC
jgi:hypothetical protein